MRKMKRKEILKSLVNNGHYDDLVREAIISDNSITEISIDVNNACNLNCRHCYWGINNLHQPELSSDEINNFINENSDVGLFAFAGKEPFLTKKIFDVLAYLKKVKKSRYGVVTNGTLAAQYAPTLAQLDLSYIDVSLDGTKEIHDAIRGKGVYEEAVKSLKAFVEYGVGERRFVSTCLNKFNSKSIPLMINEISNIGIDGFSIIPFVHCDKNDSSFQLSVNDFMEFTDVLLQDKNMKQTKADIILDLEWFTLPVVSHLFDSGYLLFDDVKEDSYGNAYIKKYHGNSRVFFKFALIDFSRFVVTADGYFGNILIKRDNHYYRNSAGNIRENKIANMREKTVSDALDFINTRLKAAENGNLAGC